eukprot:6732302-Prymnesium_polylepis.1
MARSTRFSRRFSRSALGLQMPRVLSAFPAGLQRPRALSAWDDAKRAVLMRGNTTLSLGAAMGARSRPTLGRVELRVRSRSAVLAPGNDAVRGARRPLDRPGLVRTSTWNVMGLFAGQGAGRSLET